MKNYWLKENEVSNSKKATFNFSKGKRSYFSITNISNDYLLVGLTMNTACGQANVSYWSIGMETSIEFRDFESAVSIIGNVGQKFVFKQIFE